MGPSAMSWVSFTDQAIGRGSHCPPAYLSLPRYFGPVFPQGTNHCPVSPIERMMDCRRRCSRTTIPLIQAWVLTYQKSLGMTCGPGRDSECVVSHPAKPSFEKSHPGGLYAACSSAKSAGRGVYGEHGFAPSALYLQALCSLEPVLLRVYNAITAGRDRAVRRVGELAAATQARRPG